MGEISCMSHTSYQCSDYTFTYCMYEKIRNICYNSLILKKFLSLYYKIHSIQGSFLKAFKIMLSFRAKNQFLWFFCLKTWYFSKFFNEISKLFIEISKFFIEISKFTRFISKFIVLILFNLKLIVINLKEDQSFEINGKS